jgi:hypothetical protein
VFRSTSAWASSEPLTLPRKLTVCVTIWTQMTEPQQKLSPALGDMSKEEFRRFGHELVDWVAEYLEHVEDLPVLAQIEPGDLKAQLPAAPPEKGEAMEKIIADVDR